MEIEVKNEDPFKIRDLWRPSKFGLLQLPPIESLAWDSELPEITEGLFENPLYSLKENGSFLFQLNVFGTRPLESFENDNVTNESSSQPNNHTDSDETSSVLRSIEYDHLWDLENLYRDLRAKPTLRSWDSFSNSLFREPVSAYLSEFGAKGLDAAFAHKATISGLENSGRIVRTDVFQESLFRLGLGWNSMFFHYNEKLRAFEKSFRDTRITGISLPSIDGLISDVSLSGTNMKTIRSFLRLNPSLSHQPSSLSSLACAISFLVTGLEKQLLARFTRDSSLIEIQWLFRQCGSLLNVLAELVAAVGHLQSDAEIISIVLNKCDASIQQYPWMADLLQEVLCRSAQLWCNLVETWIGLRSETPGFIRLIGNKKTFIEVEPINESQGRSALTSENDFLFDPSRLPSFIPLDQGHIIFETGKSLRLLRRTQPDHPLAQINQHSDSDIPTFYCAFTWQDIENIQQKANEYEEQLRAEILRYNTSDAVKTSLRAHGNEEIYNKESRSSANVYIDCFNLIDIDSPKAKVFPESTSLDMDSLHRKATEPNFFSADCMTNPENSFGPPLSSAFHLSLAPVLSIQAQLVDFSCLRLLFKEHRLRYHLDLQWRFQLLGDGYFSSRLSHALFDEEMESAERRSGAARGGIRSGLRLGSRDTWPPASSELRLVLMGVLSECHATHEMRQLVSRRKTQTQTDNDGENSTNTELPGGLSFAIRELTGAELDKCKDPNAIEALDFLRLQYKPPWELECFITPNSLRKYDRLFKHLLRLKRMVALTQGLIRDVTKRGSLTGDIRNIFQKFRIDAHHFIMCLNEYTHQVTIGSTWHSFYQILAHIERHLDRNDIDGAMGIAGSLPRLRNVHESILDQILFALLLSRKLEQARGLLLDCFATILMFAPLSRLDGREGVRSQQNEKIVYQLHVTFRKQVGTFVRYLRNLEGIKKSVSGFGNISNGNTSLHIQHGGVNLFQHLVLMLSMRDYY